VFVVQLAGPHGFVDPVFNSRRHHVHLVVRIRVLEIAQAQDHRPRLVFWLEPFASPKSTRSIDSPSLLFFFLFVLRLFCIPYLEEMDDDLIIFDNSTNQFLFFLSCVCRLSSGSSRHRRVAQSDPLAEEPTSRPTGTAQP
jgi:hypothetical protein